MTPIKRLQARITELEKRQDEILKRLDFVQNWIANHSEEHSYAEVKADGTYTITNEGAEIFTPAPESPLAGFLIELYPGLNGKYAWRITRPSNGNERLFYIGPDDEYGHWNIEGSESTPEKAIAAASRVFSLCQQSALSQLLREGFRETRTTLEVRT